MRIITLQHSHTFLPEREILKELSSRPESSHDLLFSNAEIDHTLLHLSKLTKASTVTDDSPGERDSCPLPLKEGELPFVLQSCGW